MYMYIYSDRRCHNSRDVYCRLPESGNGIRFNSGVSTQRLFPSLREEQFGRVHHLPLSPSIWTYRFGEPKLFLAPKLTDLYRRPSMST